MGVDFELFQSPEVIFTRADNHDIQMLSDVRGRIIATPNVNNFGAYRTQEYELRKVGVHLPQDVQVIRALPTHEAVVQAVLDQKADVGFMRAGALENMESARHIPF